MTDWWLGDGTRITTWHGDSIRIPGGLIEHLGGADEYALTLGRRAHMLPVWRLWDVWEEERE